MEIFLLIMSKKQVGRGAYVCNDTNCFEFIVKKNRLKSALKTNVDDKKYKELRGVIFDTGD